MKNSNQQSEPAEYRLRTILHPTDFSEFSDHAFAAAAALARAEGARLLVLHAASPGAIYSDIGPAALGPTEEELDALHARLRGYQANDPRVHVEHWLELGDAVTVILELAAQEKCDLIVMGTHGRTGWGRLLLGSVAEQVVRRAQCPVLTVKVPSGVEPAMTPEEKTANAASVTTAGAGNVW